MPSFNLSWVGTDVDDDYEFLELYTYQGRFCLHGYRDELRRRAWKYGYAVDDMDLGKMER